MPIRGVDPASVPERLRTVFFQSPFAEHVDMEVVSVEGGDAVLRFPFKREFTQYQGAVQGGFIVAYADASMAFAVASIIPEGRDFVTTDLNVQYLRSFVAGTVVAHGSVEQAGKSLVRGRATVSNADGSPIAICTATFMIVNPRGAAKK